MTLIWFWRTDERSRGQCLAPNYRPVMVLGVVGQPLPSEHRCVWPVKVFFVDTEHFQASWLLFFRVK